MMILCSIRAVEIVPRLLLVLLFVIRKLPQIIFRCLLSAGRLSAAKANIFLQRVAAMITKIMLHIIKYTIKKQYMQAKYDKILNKIKVF